MLHSELGKVFGEWQELHLHLPIHLFTHFHFALPGVLTETSPEVRESPLRKVPALPRIKQNSHLHIYRIALVLSIVANENLIHAFEFRQTTLFWGKKATL